MKTAKEVKKLSDMTRFDKFKCWLFKGHTKPVSGQDTWTCQRCGKELYKYR